MAKVIKTVKKKEIHSAKLPFIRFESNPEMFLFLFRQCSFCFI